MEARKSFLLRIDPQLLKELEAWAQAELRSVNGQIEFVLKQALQKRKKATTAEKAAESNASQQLPVEQPRVENR